MVNLSWRDIIERKDVYTIYVLYLNFLCEVLCNKKIWV